MSVKHLLLVEALFFSAVQQLFVLFMKVCDALRVAGVLHRLRRVFLKMDQMVDLPELSQDTWNS